MKDTIKARFGEYRVMTGGYAGGCQTAVVCDGEMTMMEARVASFAEYAAARNADAELEPTAVFTADDGKQYIYWRDEVEDIDYITRAAKNKLLWPD